MRVLSVAQAYTRTPGPRYESEGTCSGARFRHEVLVNALNEALADGETLLVDLDGTAGYGTAFLEEAFGGLVRVERFSVGILCNTIVVKSDEEPYLIEEIWQYITEATPTPT
jgi:hypothetical protein